MAGVEHYQIGVFPLESWGNALRSQQFRHAFAIIDVHLAAEAFDAVGFWGRGGAHDNAPVRPVGGKIEALSVDRLKDRVASGGSHRFAVQNRLANQFGQEAHR